MMRKLMFVTAGFLSFGVTSAKANNLYIAQNATGAASGADCADARAYTTLGSSDWVAGNVIHLCGTFSMPAGASGVIVIGGSGTSGNPITVKFETGAIATTPYWGANGFITASNQNYIVVDGGTDGSVTSTANGTNLANQQSVATGVHFNTVSNAEIKNLNVSNMYVHACVQPLTNCTDANGGSSYGIEWLYGSNVTIDGNSVHDAFGCIRYVFNTGISTNVSVFGNNVYNCNWGINTATGGTNAVLNGDLIYGNHVHDWGNWDNASNYFHHDGIFVFTTGTGAAINGLQIFNNLIYGNIATTMTGHIYISQTPGTITNAYVYNNVMSNTSSGYAADGYLSDWSTNSFIFNNTIVGRVATNMGGTGYIQYGNGSTLVNNIITSCYAALLVNTGASIGSSDYNDIYNCAQIGTTSTTLSQWQAATGFDAHSTAGNPLLNVNSSPPYQLVSTSSPAYHSGSNLTNYCSTVPALCTDAAGSARPSSGAWEMGAYQLAGSKSGGAPNPPAGLIAVVN